MMQWSKQLLVLMACVPSAAGLDTMLRRSSRNSVSISLAKDANEQQEIAALLKKSEELSQTLDEISARSELSPETRQFLSSLRVCGSCHQFERLGEYHDGGYLTCMDGWQNGGVHAAFSMGVEQHDKWSLDMSSKLHGANNGHYVVHQFDCTVAAGQPCPGCQFHKVCIGPENGPAKPNFWSMSQVLQNTGLATAADRSLIMKMDIEAAEWPILAAETPNVLHKFQQVILEFHWLRQEHMHAQYAAAVQSLLNAGFRVVHIHGNNFGGVYNVAGTPYTVPDVLEVTFVAGAPATTCQSRQQLNPLDTHNNPHAAPLPMANLPSP